LDLLQLASVYVAQLRAGPAKVMRSEMIELDAGGAVSNHIPDHVLRDSFTP
jgi:hypothetical protein